MPKLDRLVEFDSRSRNYDVRTLLPQQPLRSYTWSCLPHLDQGQEGACVGYGWAHEAAAKPVVRPATQADAEAIYRRAQQLDGFPDDEDGSSVIAGAKAMQECGWLRSYRWAFTLQDTLAAVAYHGPVVIGVPWLTGMMEPDSGGVIHATGQVEGGHCTLVVGVNVKREQVRIHNSWGPEWGAGGDCFLSFDDLGIILRQQGEACVPVLR